MKPFHKIHLDHGLSANKQSVMMLILIGVGILSLTVVVIDLQRINHQVRLLQSKIHQGQLDQARPSRVANEMLSLQGKDNAGKRDEINAVQSAITELNIPWDPLFSMLESLKIPHIKLMTVEPNPRQHRVRISAESATTDDMFGYIAALTNQHLLSHVTLLTHERSEDGRELPISFVIEATWRN